MAEGKGIDPKTAEELAKATQAVRAAAVETTRAFEEQLKIVTQLRDAMSQLADSTKSMGESPQGGMMSPDKWQEVTKQIEKTRTAAKSSSDVMTKLGKVMKSDVTKGAMTAAGAITGLGQGFRNLFAVMKAGAGIFKSITGAAFGLGKALLSVPFKISSALQNMASKGGGGNELIAQLEEIRENFGSLKSDSSQAIIQTANNMMTMNQTGVDSYRIFGNTAERLKLVTELANGMGASFQTFQDEIVQNGTAIISYQKGLGLTNEQMGSLASNAMRMGKGVAQVQNEMTKQALGMSKAFGVNAKVLSKDMGKAMQDLAHFGHLSTKEMAVAATFANKLGVSVDKLTSVMDATSTFDQAAEGMSKLNEQFGTNIDATAIMSAQNPAEKVEMLRKEFAKTGKSLESMTYQERMLIKQSSGLTDEMMNAAFSAKNAGVSLDAIQRQGSKNEKKTLSQADAMHELADSIKRLTPSGDAGSGSIFDRFIEGFGRGIMGSKEFVKLMNNIRQIFRIATMEGVKLGRMFVDLFPGVKDILGGLGDLFNPARFKRMFDGVLKSFKEFGDSGSKDVGKLMDNIQKNFLNFFNEGEGPGKKVLAGFGKFFEAIGIIFGKLTEWLVKKMAQGVAAITEFIKNPQIPKVAGGPGGSKIMEAFSGVLDAFKTQLLPALKDLGSLLWEKFVKFFKETIVGSTAGKVAIGGAIATVLLPAVTGALGGAGAGSLLKKAGGSLLGGAAGALNDASAAEGAMEAAGSAAGPAAAAIGGAQALKGTIETVGSALPEKEVIEKIKAAGEAGATIKFKDLAKFLLGIGMVIGLGLVAMAASIKLIRAMNITVKDMAVASALLLAILPPMAAAGLLVVEANKIGSIVQGGIKETLAGLAAMGLVLVAMGAVGLAMGALTKKVGIQEMLAGAEVLNTMANVFMKAGLIIGEAALIGTGIIASAGIGAVAIIAGLSTMALAVGMMATTATDIMRSLGKIEGNPAELKQKAEAFTGILGAISGMANVMKDIIKEMNAGIIDMLFGDSTTKKVEKMSGFVQILLNGKDGKGGIQGIVTTIMRGMVGGIGSLSDSQLAAFPSVANVFKVVVDLINSIATAAKGGGGIGNIDIKNNQGIINVVNQAPNVSELISSLSESMPKIFDGIVQLTSKIPADKGFAKKLETVTAIFDVFSKMTSTIGRATESSDWKESAKYAKPGEAYGPIQEMGRQMSFVYNVLQLLNGEKILGDTKTPSLNDMTSIIGKLKVPNEAGFKSKLGGIGTLFETIGKITKSIGGSTTSVSDVKQGEGPIQAFARQIRFLYNILQVLSGQSIGVAGGVSLKQISEVMKKITVDQALFGKANELVLVSNKITALAGSMTNISNKMGDIKTAYDKMKGNVFQVQTAGVTANIKAIQEMVAQTKQLDQAMANLPNIDMKAKLTAIAKGMGLGGKNVYTVDGKDVIINVTLTVTMEAGEVENVIIGRKESIIRDRINFALDRGAKSDPSTKNALIKPNKASNSTMYGTGIANSGG